MQIFTRLCVLNVRQNRKERLMQKKWSHMDGQLFSPLDEKEVSLKVNQASFNENASEIPNCCQRDVGILSGIRV